MKAFFLSLCLFFTGISYLQAQEDCGNGIDDTGNGLIDCSDPYCIGGATPSASRFNTANNGAGGRLPGGSNDPNWRIATAYGGPYSPTVVMTSPPPNYYSSPWVDCNWISHSTSGSHSVNMDYYYRVEFFLPCENSCGESYADENVFCLSMDFFADNSVYEIYVNGLPQSSYIGTIPVTSPNSHQGYAFAGRLSTSLCRDWRPGRNELIVHIKSGPGYAGFLAQYGVNAPPQGGDPSITSPTGSAAGYCVNGASVTYTAASTGGTWSATCGTCINASTGVFNPSVAGTGTHTITYTASGPCAGYDTVAVEVYPSTDASITPQADLCVDSPPVTLTAASTGGTWSGPGITNTSSGTFDPATAGAGLHTITYTISGTCGDVQTTSIRVHPSGDAAITPQAPLCTNSPAVTLTAASPGGTWSGTGITNASTGVFNPAIAGPGTHTITYTIPGPCGSTRTTQIQVATQSDATITPQAPLCRESPAVMLSAATPGGTWSGTGIINTAIGLFDPAAAGPGTHTITYSIPGSCGDTRTTTITVNQVSMTGVFAHPVCVNTHDGHIIVTPVGVPPYTYSLSGAATQQNTTGQFTGLSEGVYTVVATDQNGCSASISYVLTAPLPVTAGFSVNPSRGPAPLTVEFTNLSSNATDYYWDFGNGHNSSSANPLPEIYTTGGATYQVMLIVSNGQCQDTAYAWIQVDLFSSVIVYNVFSPNGDGVNDEYLTTTENLKEFSLTIYNRWGQELFHTTNPAKGWNGKSPSGNDCSEGTYYYVVKATGLDEKEYNLKGHLTLIRK